MDLAGSQITSSKGFMVIFTLNCVHITYYITHIFSHE